MIRLLHSFSSRRRFTAALLASGFTLASSAALAQPTRKDTPLRTPMGPGQVQPAQARPGQPTPGQPTPGQPNQPQPGQAGQPMQPGQPGQPPISRPPDIAFKAPAPGARVNINMSDVELPQLVETISNFTGRRFIISGRLRAGVKATIVSPQPVTVDEAYEAFLSVLESNGLTVIPHGRYLKIVESAGVVSQPTQVLGTATPVPSVDRFITRLYRPKNVDATEAANVLNKFKSKDGDITIYPPSNLLIFTDTGTNIRRMLRILEDLDAGGAGEQIWVQPIHNMAAADLAAKLGELLEGQGRARIFAEERSNNLIIIGTESDYSRLLELVKRIDQPVPTDNSGINVLPLQHAQCIELSQTLGAILGGGTGATAAPARQTAAQRRQAGATPAAGPTSAAGEAGGLFEGEVRVTCDEATNALITVSSLRDYVQLRSVIDRLDQPRRQVFIEAVIMDVNVDHTRDLGLSYHGGGTADLGGSGETIFYGGSNPGQSLTGLPANLEALAFGVRGPDLEGTSQLLGTGVSIPAFGVVLHALAKSGDSNVLATPHILATDNITAEISIGQNIPLQTNLGGGLNQLAGLAGGATGQAAGGLAGLGLLGGGFGFQAPRSDVGIKLSITPHINDSDQVRMEIQEEFSDAGSPVGALGAVPINKRTADTTVIVRDQQTVVIGGLVREGQVNGVTKIPILGDIPVLGMLFRQTNTKTQKTNLLLILTPHIVRDQNDLRRIFERKMQERQEFLDRYFVFDNTSGWEPLTDYSRANGLIEHIRQTQLHIEERERLAAELTPKEPKTHEPVKPIALPATARPTAAGAPAPTAAPAARPARGTSRANRPNFRVPGGRTTNPRRYRIE